MPALLLEYLLSAVDIRIKDSIQVHMHQVLKINVIYASHRIDGLVRIGNRIEEGIQRSLHQLHKRILDREIPGST